MQSRPHFTTFPCRRRLLAPALCLGLAAVASAGEISSSDFSFGYDKTANVTTWTLVSPSTPATQGDFTFTPTVGGDSPFSANGPVFTNRIFSTGGTSGYCGRTAGFVVSIAASYNGSATVTEITLEITQIRIYGGKWLGYPGDGQMQWVETTAGHTGSGPEVDLAGSGVSTNLKLTTAYSNVFWDPVDFAVAGTSATRTFALAADQLRFIDGLEIFGRVTVRKRDFRLNIAHNGTTLDFDWPSRVGKQYDLLNATSLDTPPDSWPVYQNYQAIPASGTDVNTLTGIPIEGARRFFVVAERATPSPPPGPGVLELLRVARISGDAKHCAFTGLARFNGEFYCTWREASTHVSADGKLRVVRSTDGTNWTSVALMARAGVDLRDAKIEVTPDNRLMLHACEKFPDGSSPLRRTLAWFSTDGTTWSDPVYIAENDIWFWKHTWHNGIGYGVGYACASPYFARLYTSTDATTWTTHVATLNNNGYVNESSIVFMPDATAHCLLRRDSGSNTALLGSASPPYTNWTWQDLGRQIGGPEMILLPDNRLLAAVRLLNPLATWLCWASPEDGTLTPVLQLPSGGDTSYAGMVWHNNRLWISYYSSHEGPTCVYFAEVAYNPPAG